MRKLRAIPALWRALRRRAYLGDPTVPDDVDAFLRIMAGCSTDDISHARATLDDGATEWHKIHPLTKLKAL